MKWHCCACHLNFDGPKDRSPGSCAFCGSYQIFDINVERVEIPSGGYIEFFPRPVLHGKN